MLTDFEKKVLQLVGDIPLGKVSTYGQIAKKLKRPNSARAVGNALNKNNHLISTPCHRVVRGSGNVGGYALGAEKKIKLLKKEGVEIKKGKVVNLESKFFKF